jgi:hypothetical protein
MRIAMWSGPRNISTALMRSWESRADTFVTDEPFYAYYLTQVEVDHPGREEVLAAHESDWKRVAGWLSGPIPGGRPIWYQKQMAHHLLPEIEGEWLDHLVHAFLIRDPKTMIASLSKVLPAPVLRDTGLPQQVAIFERARETARRPPPVIAAEDVLRDPKAMLIALCDALDVPWDESMLQWEAGPRPTDGVWAKHWYAAVEASTGFQPYRERKIELPETLEDLVEECLPWYERLREHRLVPGHA